jgi:hypothetical protein
MKLCDVESRNVQRDPARARLRTPITALTLNLPHAGVSPLGRIPLSGIFTGGGEVFREAFISFRISSLLLSRIRSLRLSRVFNFRMIEIFALYICDGACRTDRRFYAVLETAKIAPSPGRLERVLCTTSTIGSLQHMSYEAYTSPRF